MTLKKVLESLGGGEQEDRRTSFEDKLSSESEGLAEDVSAAVSAAVYLIILCMY